MRDPAAYFAGLFDGEGSVTIHCKPNGSMQCTLTVVNTHKGVLDQLVEWAGGALTSRVRREGQRPCWAWQISGPGSDAFARRILPHSVVKAEQLELYLQARELLTGAPLTDTSRAIRQDLQQRAVLLKAV